jgi:hypothetical protein
MGRGSGLRESESRVVPVKKIRVPAVLRMTGTDFPAETAKSSVREEQVAGEFSQIDL